MRITFTGDISFTGNFKRALENGSLNISDEVSDIFKKSDFNVVNLEGPATTHPAIFDKDLSVLSPVMAIDYLSKKLNINVFNLANNHTFDAGIDGFNQCVQEIESKGLSYFGAGENIEEAAKIEYLKKDDITVALIAVGSEGSSGARAREDMYGVFGWEDDLVYTKIEEAKENADWVILNFHNGAEFNFCPVKSKQDRLKLFVDKGVDIVVAHHPHVIQGIEKYNEGIIFYSLGNFIFDLKYHRKKKYTNLSLIPTFCFTKRSYTYSHSISEFDPQNCIVTLNNSRKINGFFNKICENLKEENRYRQKDALRCIFFNPLWSGHWWINICFPLLIPYHLYTFRKGNNKELLYEALMYFRCEFLYKWLISIK